MILGICQIVMASAAMGTFCELRAEVCTHFERGSPIMELI